MFTANREDLLAACTLAHAAVSHRPLMPTYHDLHVRTDAGPTIYVTGSDTEITVQVAVVPISTSGVGAVCLPTKKLLDILKSSRSQDVTVEVRKNKAVVLTADDIIAAKHEMTTRPVADYGVAVEPDWPHNVVYDRVKLHAALTHTVFAAASREGKFGVLCGVHFDHAEGLLVGGDGKRVAIQPGRAAQYLNEPAAKVVNSTIHRRHVQAVISMLAAAAEDFVRVAATAREMTFGCGSMVVRCRPMEGEYPLKRILSVFPKTATTTLAWRAGDFLMAIRQAEMRAAGETRRVSLTVSEDMNCMFRSVDQDGATASVAAYTAGGSGSPLTIDFDASEVRRMLEMLDADDVVPVTFCGPDRVFVIGHPSGGRYGVVPMAKSSASPANAPPPAPKGKKYEVPAWEAAG